MDLMRQFRKQMAKYGSFLTRNPDSHFSIRSEEIARGIKRGDIDPIVPRVHERVSRRTNSKQCRKLQRKMEL